MAQHPNPRGTVPQPTRVATKHKRASYAFDLEVASTAPRNRRVKAGLAPRRAAKPTEGHRRSGTTWATP